MPILNRRGDVIMGGGGVLGSLNQVPYPFETYGAGCFQDDDTIIAALRAEGAVLGRWKIGAPAPTVIEPRRVGQSISGGGGQWLALGPQEGATSVLYGSIPDRVDAGAASVSIDGSVLAFKTRYHSYVGLTLLVHGHELAPETVTADGVTTLAQVDPRDLQALPHGQAIWYRGAYGRAIPRPHHAQASGVKLGTTDDGTDWLLYYAPEVGLVLHVDGEHAGYVLEARGVFYGYDLVARGNDVIVASAWTAAEIPSDLVKLVANRHAVGYLVDVNPARVVPTWQTFDGEPEPPEPPDGGDEFMEPWRVTITHWDDIIQERKQFSLTANLGNGVSVLFEKRENDSLHVTVAKDDSVQDASGADRIVDVIGEAPPPEPEPGPEPIPPQPPKAESAALRTHNGHFLVVAGDAEIEASAATELEATRVVFEAHGDRYAIRTVAFGRLRHRNRDVVRSVPGKYLRAEDGGNKRLLADRDTPNLDPAASDELFTITAVEDGIAMAGRLGTFVVAEEGGGGLVAVDREGAGVWETFEAQPPEALAPPAEERGVIRAGVDVFTDEAGQVWSYSGLTMFLLFYRWLMGESIDAVVNWCIALGANTVRVLGMVYWPPSQIFGPTINANWWAELPRFLDYLAARQVRIEFVVFASAQDLMPDEDEQRDHLRRVVDTIGGRWNVFIEVANEPQQNGCEPPAIFAENAPRGCAMAYGLYQPEKHQDEYGTWIAELPALDYLTAHTPRDADSWSRKAKDLSEYRDGSGDGTENAPRLDGLHVPPVGDEPMGTAEAKDLAGRQRSNIPQDFFWYAANAAINGAGSTGHGDFGLQAVVPPPDGDQQKCMEAVALAWASVPPEFQQGSYTRGGLNDLPLVWEGEYFPEQTSRIYGRILGNRAVCVAIKPNAGWTPKAAPGWKIVKTIGPMNSLVHLER